VKKLQKKAHRKIILQNKAHKCSIGEPSGDIILKQDRTSVLIKFANKANLDKISSRFASKLQISRHINSFWQIHFAQKLLTMRKHFSD
jgi:hypothetical protein